MMHITRKIIFTLLLGCLAVQTLKAQPNQEKILVDQVVAVVGGNIILYSDIENEYLQFIMQGNVSGGSEARCMILEELLFQKLLLNQAELDSVVVTDKQVDAELDRRMRYFIAQVGSQQKLEEYFKKSILEIKQDLRSRIKDYLMIQSVQSKITQDVRVTPSEVGEFFRNVPEDSIPLIPARLEIAQIVKKPIPGAVEIEFVREKLNALRERILKGEDFATLANLYSEDPGSMKKGGELGFTGRGIFYPEFEAVAFSLKPGEISPVIRTKSGFHIIQMIERRGEMVNVRHILVIPKPSPTDMANARKELDRIKLLIESDSLSFEQAALKFSDDPGKNNGGMMINEYTGDTKFEPEEIEASLFFTIDKLTAGQISVPQLFTDEEGAQAYRIVMLKSRTSPHKANLRDDYPLIQNIVLAQKQNEKINRWIRKKTETTFIKITDDYSSCNFRYNWGIKQ